MDQPDRIFQMARLESSEVGEVVAVLSSVSLVLLLIMVSRKRVAEYVVSFLLAAFFLAFTFRQNAKSNQWKTTGRLMRSSLIIS